MQKISYWASCNIASARALIVIIKILLALICCYTGMILFKMGLIIPSAELYPIICITLVASIIFYPAEKKPATPKKIIYARQKSCDFILSFCAALFLITWVNNADIVNTNAVYGSSTVKQPTAQQILNSSKTKQTLTGKEKRILKKEFFKQLKVYSKAIVTGDKAKATEAWKVILAIIGLVGLLYLLAALVCSLSCSGADVAAVIIGVLGLAGLIWAFIAVLKAIRHKPKKVKVE